MLSKFDIQKLQDLPIEQVANALGLEVCRHKCLCPFHDDSHPSLTFSTSRNRYRCYVCDARGGTIDLVMRYLKKDFLEACRWLADDNHTPVTVKVEPAIKPPKPFDASRYERFFQHPWLSDEAKRFLFEDRRLDPRVIRWCRLTSWRDKQGVPWLQVPYFDRSGQLIGVQNRNLSSYLPQPSSLNPQPRFRFPSGSACSIYNLPVLNHLRPGETLFIAEGCSDAWSLMSAGHKAIAIPSATLLTRKDKELLQSLNSQPSSLRSTSGRSQGENLHFAMYPDNDEPGYRLFLQLQETLPNLVHHQLPAGCKDFSDYYLKSLISHP